MLSVLNLLTIWSFKKLTMVSQMLGLLLLLLGSLRVFHLERNKLMAFLIRMATSSEKWSHSISTDVMMRPPSTFTIEDLRKDSTSQNRALPPKMSALTPHFSEPFLDLPMVSNTTERTEDSATRISRPQSCLSTPLCRSFIWFSCHGSGEHLWLLFKILLTLHLLCTLDAKFKNSSNSWQCFWHMRDSEDFLPEPTLLFRVRSHSFIPKLLRPLEHALKERLMEKLLKSSLTTPSENQPNLIF